MIKHIIYLLCSWTIIQGCISNSKQLPKITLSYDDPTIEMKFSEIADSIQIIRIETNDSVLVPDYFTPCIGKKYFIITFSDGIHQFFKNGRYIRKMLNQGRGPEEFYGSHSEQIDDQKERFFMIERGVNIISYDLKKGEMFEKHHLPFMMSLLQSNNDTLLCSPFFLAQKMTCSDLLSAYTPQGEMINKLKDTITNGSASDLSIMLSAEGKIRLKTHKSDTVYTIDNFNKIPAYTIKGIPNEHRVPLSITLHAETPNYYFFRTHSVEIVYKEQGEFEGIIEYAPSKSYQVNKKDYSSKIVEKVYIDTLGISIPFTSIHLDPKAPYLTLSAFRFKEALREKAEQNKLSPAMKKLYEEVKEDDNPLIFIGQYK